MKVIKSDPITGLEMCKRCNPPSESRITNLLGDTASMEIAFTGILLLDLEVSNSLLLNAAKQTPSSHESCFSLTDLCLTTRSKHTVSGTSLSANGSTSSY